jgi:hypothetical protein
LRCIKDGLTSEATSTAADTIVAYKAAVRAPEAKRQEVSDELVAFASHLTTAGLPDLAAAAQAASAEVLSSG